MVHTIEEPSVPFVGPVKGGFEPGTMIRIQGQVPSDGDRFNINLHCGSPPSDIALHVSVRLLQSYIARNSFLDGDWGDEEDAGNLPIGLGEHFEILLLCDPGSIKIAVNGNHFGEFQHRIPFKKISHLEIDGTVAIKLIAFESASLPAAPPPPRMAEGAEMPPGYGPPPPPDNFGYGPPPPQGSFGGGPGHYPHQRGQDGESGGFESFLGNAGSAIASVMVSGLAENLLGGLSGQSQRHPSSPQPQNQMYNDGGHRQGGGSIVDDLLGSLTGGGGQSHQQRPPQSQSPMYNQGGQQQQGGGSTIVSDILGSLASEMFKPSRRSQMPIPPPKGYSNQPFSGPGPVPFAPPHPTNMYGQPHPQPNPYVPAQPTQMSFLPPPQPMPFLPPHPNHMPHPHHVPQPHHMPQPHILPHLPPQLPHMPNVVHPHGIVGPPFPHTHDRHLDKKMRKKMRKAMKHGVPVAGVGVGAYSSYEYVKHHKHHKKDKHKSSSSSSSDSD